MIVTMPLFYLSIGVHSAYVLLICVGELGVYQGNELIVLNQVRVLSMKLYWCVLSLHIRVCRQCPRLLVDTCIGQCDCVLW